MMAKVLIRIENTTIVEAALRAKAAKLSAETLVEGWIWSGSLPQKQRGP